MVVSLESGNRLQQWDVSNVEADEPFLCVHKASVVSSSYSSWHMHVFSLKCLDTTDILSLPIFFMCYAAGM